MERNDAHYLITGATGFIGGRLVEKLCLENQAQVRSLIRTPANAVNIGRFPISMHQADITDQSSLNSAMKGIDTVFHCAHHFEEDAEANRKATENLLNAALDQQVNRVIVLSTADVYDASYSNPINEKTPLKSPGGNSYVDAKLAVEYVCREYFEKYKAPVVILQPTIVYGPWGPAWTTRIFNLLRSGKMPLVNRGNGLCNAIFVDDLVDLMISAANKPEIEGESFIASNPHTMTWKTFFSHFETIIGEKRTLEMNESAHQSVDIMLKRPLQQIKTHIQQMISPWLPRSLKHQLKKAKSRLENPDRPTPLTPAEVTYFSSKATYDVVKVENLLNFQPQFSHEAGFKQIAEWYHHYYKRIYS